MISDSTLLSICTFLHSQYHITPIHLVRQLLQSTDTSLKYYVQHAVDGASHAAELAVRHPFYMGPNPVTLARQTIIDICQREAFTLASDPSMQFRPRHMRAQQLEQFDIQETIKKISQAAPTLHSLTTDLMLLHERPAEHEDDRARKARREIEDEAALEYWRDAKRSREENADEPDEFVETARKHAIRTVVSLL
jgi:HEPN domain-containing protein